MKLYQKYNTSKGWQEEIETSKKIITFCDEKILSLENEKKSIFLFKKKKEKIDNEINLFQKFKDDAEIHLKKSIKEKKKYEDKEKKEES